MKHKWQYFRVELLDFLYKKPTQFIMFCFFNLQEESFAKRHNKLLEKQKVKCSEMTRIVSLLRKKLY